MPSALLEGCAARTAAKKSTTDLCTDGAPRGSEGLTHPRWPPAGVTASHLTNFCQLPTHTCMHAAISRLRAHVRPG